jgi:hypothetical protein
MQTKTQEYYDRDGTIIDGEDKAFAKKVLFDLHDSADGKLTQYFIKSCDGMLCNPINFEQQRTIIKRKTKFTKTNELAFLLYLRFLRTKSNSAYSQAQRQLGGG